MLASQDPVVHERVLDLIKRCIAAGERAPLNPDIPSGSATTREMAALGLLKVEVYARNWRVIELADGSRTAEPPFGNTGPYRTIP